MRRLLALLIILNVSRVFGAEIQKYSFPLPPETERADVYAIKAVKTPRAVLVLCPGRNGNGEGWIREPAWQDFAKENHLGLVGISFASPDALLNQWHGYTIVSKGAGQTLLDAVRKIYGHDLPILFYGFSAGAVFTNEFVEWKPERVIAWCACAGEDEAQSRHENSPPGIISCGEYDGTHYGADLMYFKQGRALGKPWIWISAGKKTHSRSPEVEGFVRQYFSAILNYKKAGCWVDIDSKAEISIAEAAQVPSVSGLLPNRELLDKWRNVHVP